MTNAFYIPKVAALELTYKCNHRCIFCSCPWEANENYKDNELTFSEWGEVITTLKEKGVQTFTLTGGEPLLRSDVCDLIAFIKSQNAKVVLISNGRAMDNSFIKFLAEQDVALCISVPGINTFKHHTGVDNIRHVLRLFEMARKYGIKSTANIAVTKTNLPELYRNIALPLIHGAEYVLLNRFLPGGRGLENTKYLLNMDETNEMLEVAETVLSKANRFGHVGTELPLCAIKSIEKYKHLQVSSRCAAAKGFFIIDPSGFIKVCNHSPQRVCHYKDLDSLGKNSYWRMFQEKAYLPDMCMACDKTDLCDGGCREAAHVFYGSVTDKDPIFHREIK